MRNREHAAEAGPSWASLALLTALFAVILLGLLPGCWTVERVAGVVEATAGCIRGVAEDGRSVLPGSEAPADQEDAAESR